MTFTTLCWVVNSNCEDACRCCLFFRTYHPVIWDVGHTLENLQCVSLTCDARSTKEGLLWLAMREPERGGTCSKRQNPTQCPIRESVNTSVIRRHWVANRELDEKLHDDDGASPHKVGSVLLSPAPARRPLPLPTTNITAIFSTSHSYSSYYLRSRILVLLLLLLPLLLPCYYYHHPICDHAVLSQAGDKTTTTTTATTTTTTTEITPLGAVIVCWEWAARYPQTKKIHDHDYIARLLRFELEKVLLQMGRESSLLSFC